MKRCGVWVVAALVATTWLGCEKKPEGNSPAPKTSQNRAATEQPVAAKPAAKSEAGAAVKGQPAGEAGNYVQVKLSVPNMT